MIIAGIDEAGRGPVIGPMVMAVAVIEKKDEEKLGMLGVKDSKQLSKIERETQLPEIKKILLEHYTLHIQPDEIDRMVEKKGLNELEAMKAAKLLNMLKHKPKVVYIDSPDVVMADFGKRIEKYIDFNVKIISEHKADENYPIVSAASIIAKVERDAEIEKLCKIYGQIGSGYSHDPDTITFLKKYFLQNNRLPDFARKSWQTSKDLQDQKYQKKLF
jgi:ribonuclease HII